MKTYILLNPHVEGKLNTEYEAENAEAAAEMCWQELSKYITGNMPQFAFTLQQKGGGLHHFLLNESADADGKNARYSIKPLNIKLDTAREKSFIEEVKNARNLIQGGGMSVGTVGGKSHKDDSSSTTSSSDSDLYRKIDTLRYRSSQPLYYWWYNPLIYTKVISTNETVLTTGETLKSIYMPTFVPSVLPYVHIDFSTAWWDSGRTKYYVL